MSQYFPALISAFFITFSAFSQSTELTVEVLDSNGLPVENAVVYAEPEKKMVLPMASAVVEQRGKQFNPLVSVVQTGTEITFPNFDSVRHHVYSFSPAKTFELKLYSGVPTKPVKFDKEGTVVLGCNIHDFMVAFIHVVDTPYFTKSNKSGKAVLRDLPAGNYIVKTWYYGMAEEKDIVEKKLTINQSQNLVVPLPLKPSKIPASKSSSQTQ